MIDVETCPAQPELSPDHIDGALWRMHMLSGDYEQAWQASDRIRARKTPDPHCFWTGEEIAGRDVIVRSLHGLGDAVQMFRYAPRLNALARSVTWQVPPNLMELALCFDGVERVITWEEPCKWDVQIEIVQLPHLFRTTLAKLPIATKYLRVDAGRLGRRRVDQNRLRVGVVWAAGEWNPRRSIPLAAFDRILSVAGCDFISLQGGAHTETDSRLETIGPGLLTLAQTIAGLDLVISVDTLAAHLAGALHVPAYVLLEHAADWRWMTGRDDTPWYSSLRLFRQAEPGDWSRPLQAVHSALGTLTG